MTDEPNPKEAAPSTLVVKDNRAVEISVPAGQEMSIRPVDFQRFYRLLSSIRQAPNTLLFLSSLLGGFGLSLLIGYVSLNAATPAYVTPQIALDRAWLLTAHLIGGFACVLASIVLYIVNQRLGKLEAASITHILSDMSQIYRASRNGADLKKDADEAR